MSYGIARLWSKVRQRPLSELPPLAIHLLFRQAQQFQRRRAFRRGQTSVRESEIARALYPIPVSEAIQRLGRRPLGIAHAGNEERAKYVKWLIARYPQISERILTFADNACLHRFDLLGSGQVELGPDIDWLCDFKSGFRWPPGFYSDLVPVDLSNNADVKVPWELSRCQHFVRLGQAYWLTDDERYAREFSAQLNSWIDANPVMGTINWCNAMEPAIRIVNWLWACALFRDSPSFTKADRIRFLRSALEHGRFIAANLECTPGQPSGNHYISNLVGLVYLGILLPEFQEAGRWLETGLSGLLREIETQVHLDGVDYESSTSYHRLVTELFASAFAVCRQNDVSISETVWRRLERMVEFVLWYTRPDGCAPIIGDADNGRLHILTPALPNDHRHLLAFGGMLFGRADFYLTAGEMQHEAAWWFGFRELPYSPGFDAGLGSRAFSAGGFYVMRQRDLLLIADCGHPLQVTGHAHNDTFSFELATHGQAWIVDSGTYVYTASAPWRNYFRSTAAHNTVMIDGVEINTINPSQLFILGREAIPTVNLWRSTHEYDLLDAQHNGYLRVPGGGIHRRRFYFEKRVGYWLIEDTLTGTGSHCVQMFLHFATGLDVDQISSNTILARGDLLSGLLIGLHVKHFDFKFLIKENWVSSGYGEKSRAWMTEVVLNASFPIQWTWLLLPVNDWQHLPDLPSIQAIPEKYGKVS